MKNTRLFSNVIPRIVYSSNMDLKNIFTDNYTEVLKRYADWRVGALPEESLNSDQKVVFTFDDFGSATQINRLLQILSDLQVRAVFFIQGEWAVNHSDLVTRIHDAGHIIGDHTYTHADLLTLTDDQIRAEIGGIKGTKWLRPPQGRYNDRIRQIVADMGYCIKYWSIDSDDWQGTTSLDMSRKILRQLHSGAVILFHIHGEHTAETLPELIQEIRARGYELPAPGQPIWGHK